MSRYGPIDFYCYQHTHVLKNKLGIKDYRKPKTFERKLSSLRLSEIRQNNLSFPLTFEGYKAIHKFVFQDVYGWAGQVRKVDIKKGSSRFCNFLQIDSQATRIFNDLLQSNYLIGLNNE